jgi:hypothetical protein
MRYENRLKSISGFHANVRDMAVVPNAIPIEEQQGVSESLTHFISSAGAGADGSKTPL